MPNESLQQLVHQGMQAFERGNLNDALSMFEEALELCWDINSSKDDLANCLYKIANTLRKLDKPKKAEPFYDLAKSLKTFGFDHDKTLVALNNLATLYFTERQEEKSIAIYEQALMLINTTHCIEKDKRPLYKMRFQNNLANAYQAIGRFKEAIDLYNKVCSDRERVLGLDHPNTLNSYDGLANAYSSARRLQDAIELHEQVLAARKRVLGLDHPDTLNSQHNLAEDYLRYEWKEEAIDLYEQVLAARKRVLGLDHPDTLNSQHNLASAYRSAGRITEAIDLYEQVLAARKRVLGPDHPDTLETQNALIESYLHNKSR